MTGANQVSVSPDEKTIAFYIRIATSHKLFIQDNKPGGKLQQVTKAASDEFKSIHGASIDNLYCKRWSNFMQGCIVLTHPSKPAVIFITRCRLSAKCTQMVEQLFSGIYFHNLLADNGYTVLDIDYRASAGYGRDWRTGIYRFMGGKDLTDNVDGAKLLVEKYGVDPKHIGVYGGSYGGFITLMALFTQPGVFKAGAALRPVTDWANYNHGYTANILNEPFNDSIAYKRSSPIYFANGLKDHLLICHGMMDVNVHFRMLLNSRNVLLSWEKITGKSLPTPWKIMVL
jgi:hypothetical protein